MGAHHDHEHDHAAASAGTLRTAFCLSLGVLGVEIAGGLVSHSLALISDAGHVLTDVIALALAWFATLQSQRAADATYTYGYHRTGILIALANALTLILVVAYVVYEAVVRLHDGSTVDPLPMFASAAFGIAINLYIGLGLRAHGAEDLAIRAAMLHVFGDIAASIGVIVAGLTILATRWYPADAVVSIAIAALIAKGAWQLLRETIDILMESTPKNVDMKRLVADIARVTGATAVHDVHVWSISSGIRALSAHVRLDGDRTLHACDLILEELRARLAAVYRITHTTIQFECETCDTHETDLFCRVPQAPRSVPGSSA